MGPGWSHRGFSSAVSVQAQQTLNAGVSGDVGTHPQSAAEAFSTAQSYVE